MHNLKLFTGSSNPRLCHDVATELKTEVGRADVRRFSDGEGDVTKTKQVWSYDKIHRSISTISISDGRLYVADYSGFVYCLDARTGEEHWIHDTKGHIWGSTLVADGKVYIGNEDGYMTIIPAKKTYDEKEVIEIDMVSQVYSSAVAANGVLYVATHTHLFAIAQMESE